MDHVEAQGDNDDHPSRDGNQDPVRNLGVGFIGHDVCSAN
jgi:hypothetical protein